MDVTSFHLFPLALGDLAVLFEFTNVVGSKFVLVICIVCNVQVFEPRLIRLDDSHVEFVVGDIPSMFRGQHSLHALPIA